ncbi:MAG: hypothetical protein IKU43_08625, partial [Clostridia bacterium]|nr:hypothetical protein [Clostridia bacterium]
SPFFLSQKEEKEKGEEEKERRKRRVGEEKERIEKIAHLAIKEKCHDTHYFGAPPFILIGAKIFILTPYK